MNSVLAEGATISVMVIFFFPERYFLWLYCWGVTVRYFRLLLGRVCRRKCIYEFRASDCYQVIKISKISVSVSGPC